MKKIISALVLFLTVAVFAETPLTIAISPQGAAIQSGTTQQLTAACTYAIAPSDDCTTAGGVMWSTSATSTSTIAVSSSGLVSATTDPGAGNIPGYFIVAAAGGLKTDVQVDVQHPGDTWTQYITPDYHNYADTVSGSLLPLNVVVGSTITTGSGVRANSTAAGEGTPFQGVCNWTSSDNTLATVNTEGLVTAVAPGTVTITCNVPGTWTPGTSAVTGWQTPGNYVNLTIVAGGTGTNTWYVRPGGGSPWYDGTSTPYGQCTGLTDADYSGGPTALWQLGHAYNLGDQVAASNGQIVQITTAGTSNTTQHPTWPTVGNTVTDGTAVWTAEGTYPVDQACALGNLRYLWTNLTGYETIGWTTNFHGGDTVIVRQNSNGYPMGPDNPNTFGGPSNCYGSGSQCYMPSIPSGTAAKHTQILGENYASCTSNSAKTLLYGTWGEWSIFNTKDSQFVDIACFEMTDQATCGGSTNFINHCSGQNDGTYGILQSALTASDNYTDLYIHGLAQEGIHGPTGVGVVGNRIFISAVPTGGIDMDDDPWSSSNISVAGGFTLNNSVTQFVGCVEIYPITLNYPYIECRDQNVGGYGDGFGTASATGDWVFNGDTWRYNFQDGLDLLHSGMHSLTVTKSTSYGNDGQQWKIGSGKQVTFQTNLTVHNCARIAALFGDEPNTAIVPNATNGVTHSTTSLVVTYTNGLVVTGPGITVATPTTGGSVTLSPNTTSYTWIDPTTFTLQMNTTGFPGGLPTQFKLAIIITNGTGVPSGTGYYTTENNQVSVCRAAGDGNAIAFDGLGTDLFQSNTFVGYGATSYDMMCTGGWQTCAAANTVFENNINVGAIDTLIPGASLPGLFFQQEDAQWSTIDHNLYYNFKSGCPTLHTGDVCSNSLFINQPSLTITNEASLDNFNFNLTSGSPAVHSGVYLPAITTDNASNPFANPPSMGALEFIGSPPPPTNFSGGILNGTIQ